MECFKVWAQDMRRGPQHCALATQAVIKRDRLRWSSLSIKPGTMYRLSNGRLPEFQPVVSEAEARAWLAENPNAIAWEVR